MSKHQLFFTPGPSQLYPTLSFHLQAALKENIGAISHRSSQFKLLFEETKAMLKSIMELPEGYEILLVSSATEVWERLIQNVVIESSHHYVNGAFSKRFFEFTQDYRLKSTHQTVGDGEHFQFNDLGYQPELVSITYNETSIGYSYIDEDVKVIRKLFPESIIALDVVSIAPAVKINYALADTAYFSVQKCFGLPAGLGIWIVNERVIEKAQTKQAGGNIIGSYHALPELIKQARQNQTPETPNVLGLFLLHGVLKDMLDRGIQMIQNEITYKSAILYQAIDAHADLNCFIKDKAHRSKTVIVSDVNNGNADILRYFKEKGLIIGSGYGKHKDHHIRIANFPAHSKEQIEMIADLIAGY